MAHLIESHPNGLPLPDAFACADSLVVKQDAGRRLMLLNSSARFIWERLAEGLSLPEAAREIAREFGLASREASDAVFKTVNAWKGAGLLEAAGPSTAAVPETPSHTCAGFLNAEDASLRTYDLCGIPIGVRFSPGDLEELILGRFHYSQVSNDLACEWLSLLFRNDVFILAKENEVVLATRSKEEICGAFIRTFVELSAGHGNWLAVLHGAAARLPDGRTAAFPGTNGAGKSLLSVALMEAGFSYCSDDCVPIDLAGHVVPVPFAVSIKSNGWKIVEQLVGKMSPSRDYTEVSGEDDGGRCRFLTPHLISRQASLLDMIVFPQRLDPESAGQRRIGLTAVGCAAALEKLLSSRAWISSRNSDLIAFLSLLEDVPSFTLSYSSVDQAIELMAQL